MAFLEGWGGRKHKVNEEVEAGHHYETFHDEDEDRAGEKTNLATGKAINNSGSSIDTVDTQLHVVKGGKSSKDALGALPEEEDEAAKWLRKHGDHKEAA